MKRKLSLISLILLATLALFYACTQTQATHVASDQPVSQIPELLERQQGLGEAEERQNTLNIYADLKNTLSQDPQNTKARTQLIQLFMLEARTTGEHGYYYPEALKQIDIILAQTPEKSEQFYALSLKAAVLLSLHKFPQAMEVAQAAVKLNPYNAQIHGALVDAHVEMGEYAEAVKMADKMVSLRPDLRSYARVSYLREIHGDVKGAIEAMEMAAKAGYPGYEETAWCRLTLGNLYENYGKLDEAQAQYKQILRERKDYPFAIAALANIASKKGETEKAKDLLEQACELIPEVSFYEQLVEVYDGLGMIEQSQKSIQMVLEMLEDDEQKGHNMGITFADVYLTKAKDAEKALEYALTEAKQRPNNIDVNLMLADVYFQMGKYEQASIHIDKASTTGSQNPELLDLRGKIMKQLGSEKEGEEWIAKALESNPYLYGYKVE